MFDRSDNAASGCVMCQYPGDVDAVPERACCIQPSIGGQGCTGDLLPTSVVHGSVGVLSIFRAGTELYRP